MSTPSKKNTLSISLPDEGPIRRQTTEEPILSSPAVKLTPLGATWDNEGAASKAWEAAKDEADAAENDEKTSQGTVQSCSECETLPCSQQPSPSIHALPRSNTTTPKSITPRRHNPYGDNTSVPPSGGISPRSSIPLPPSLAHISQQIPAPCVLPQRTVRFMPPPPLSPYTSDILQKQTQENLGGENDEGHRNQICAFVGNYCYSTMMRWFQMVSEVQDAFLLNPDYSPSCGYPLYVPQPSDLREDEIAFLAANRCPSPHPQQYTFEQWVNLANEWWIANFGERQKKARPMFIQPHPAHVAHFQRTRRNRGGQGYYSGYHPENQNGTSFAPCVDYPVHASKPSYSENFYSDGSEQSSAVYGPAY